MPVIAAVLLAIAFLVAGCDEQSSGPTRVQDTSDSRIYLAAEQDGCRVYYVRHYRLPNFFFTTCPGGDVGWSTGGKSKRFEHAPTPPRRPQD